MRGCRSNRTQGLTRIELVVVGGILMTLGFLIIPSITSSYRCGGDTRTQMLSNGRQIYVSVFDAATQETPVLSFPETEDFATTHDYFIALVTNDIMTVTFDFFSGPGLPEHKSTDPIGFTSNHCAWKVAENTINARDGVPFMVSRNYGDPAVKGEPKLTFHSKYVLVIQKGGAAYIRDVKDIDATMNSATLLPP